MLAKPKTNVSVTSPSDGRAVPKYIFRAFSLENWGCLLHQHANLEEFQ